MFVLLCRVVTVGVKLFTFITQLKEPTMTGQMCLFSP